MNILIVYDTVYGNTEKVAQTLQTVLARGNKVNLIKTHAASAAQAQQADLLLVGSPTHGGRPTEDVKKLLDAIPVGGLNGKRAIAFDTSSAKQGEGWFVRGVIDFFGFASRRISADLAAKGATVLGTNTFLVRGREGALLDGELERAAAWVKDLVK